MNNNTTVSPAEYFAEVKSRKQVMTEAGLSKLYENCLTLLDEYQRSGQIAAQKKLLFHIDNITREKKLLDVGIDTFVYKSDIDDFIHMVDNGYLQMQQNKNIVLLSAFSLNVNKDVFDKELILPNGLMVRYGDIKDEETGYIPFVCTINDHNVKMLATSIDVLQNMFAA